MGMTWSALTACVIAMALDAMVSGPTTALVARRSAADSTLVIALGVRMAASKL
jgi:hypothetical protein